MQHKPNRLRLITLASPNKGSYRKIDIFIIRAIGFHEAKTRTHRFHNQSPRFKALSVAYGASEYDSKYENSRVVDKYDIGVGK